MRLYLQKNKLIIQCFAVHHKLHVCAPHDHQITIQQLVKFQKSTSHVASFDSSDLAKERLRFGGLMGGSGRPEYKDSDPPTCFTNHCHVAQSWPLNHERLRFGQDCQLSHALISIVNSFYHLINARSTKKVNFLHKLNFKLVLTYLKIFRSLKSKFDICLSIWSLELCKINILPNKHTKIHKIKYS